MFANNDATKCSQARELLCIMGMKAQNQKKRGFTLTEMMVVIGIIGLLAAIILPPILNSIEKAKEKVKQRNVVNIEKAKGILQLPSAVHSLGKGLANGAVYGSDFTEEELFACMNWVEGIDDLIIDEEPIIIGNIGVQAHYSDSAAASNP